jgi:hypothetical protein
MDEGTVIRSESASAGNRIAPGPSQTPHAKSRHAGAFCGRVWRGRVDEEPSGPKGVQRKTQVREAFNSPFWPFVLATTSVGQEGLDFHQYCRDVVHWNLPANPVDLEQREGRVCRRNALVVRQAIAQAYPRVLRDDSPVWDSVFRLAEKETEEFQDHRGLCPHWIYEHSRDDAAEHQSVMVRRHVFCYEHSRDVAAYDRIRQDLALYRLAFGQPRQEDLILRPKYADTLKNGGGRFLRQFMFDLTPSTASTLGRLLFVACGWNWRRNP